MHIVLGLSLWVFPLVFGHGNEVEDTGVGMGMDMAHTHGIGMGMGAGDTISTATSMGPVMTGVEGSGDHLPTYFAHAEYSGLGYAHIILMVTGWVFVLPVAVMLSLARSRYTLASQLVFLIVHTLGLLVGAAYNTNTPDLYPNNAHHKLGWVSTWVVAAHVLLGMLRRAARSSRRVWEEAGAQAEQELRTFIPMTASTMDEHHRIHNSRLPVSNRHSNDSGHGTEGNTGSTRSNSVSTVADEAPSLLEEARKAALEDEDVFDEVMLVPRKPTRWWQNYTSKLAGWFPSGAWKVFSLWYSIVDRTILPLGFITLCTGIASYGRFFEGSGIFSGLAHWIKGGVFFWMGIFTLGRWCGSFGDLGWAWNARPRRGTAAPGWRPSAEFIESALIFTYGATNIFLEHLGSWGGEWSSQDLEHISITVLFIGGGLCGMLVESSRIRELLNTTVTDAVMASTGGERSQRSQEQGEKDGLKAPNQYEFSLNPIPSLVIVLLGIMMSSHTQHSMLSGMVHKQWGNLLLGGSLARCLTYMLVFLKPPASVLPSRPPTELLTAFGLIAGGLIFMASSSDTIVGMEHYDLDAMFFYTITMGMVGLLMAWVILLLAVKGWAARRETAQHTNAHQYGRV